LPVGDYARYIEGRSEAGLCAGGDHVNQGVHTGHDNTGSAAGVRAIGHSAGAVSRLNAGYKANARQASGSGNVGQHDHHLLGQNRHVDVEALQVKGHVVAMTGGYIHRSSFEI